MCDMMFTSVSVYLCRCMCENVRKGSWNWEYGWVTNVQHLCNRLFWKMLLYVFYIYMWKSLKNKMKKKMVHLYVQHCDKYFCFFESFKNIDSHNIYVDTHRHLYRYTHTLTHTHTLRLSHRGLPYRTSYPLSHSNAHVAVTVTV